ncbi:MAG: TetR/AcrR family transcriptional regulator [Cyclobacteriaceae bacterium]|nr:TetR/AcrR family transcriptional regulator [Cyclobacteriaceae bacterium]
MKKMVKSGKKAQSMGADKIREEYIAYILEQEKRPSTVFGFCKTIGIKEDTFYSHYGSFKALEKAIWQEYAQSTIDRLKSDSNYASFSAREKVLAFHFTLIEILKEERSFILFQLEKRTLRSSPPSFIRKFKKEFDVWTSEVIEEGKQSDEIAKRPYLDQKYGSLLWLHLHFVLMFWMKDDSAEFEKTDEAIEKSVNLAFDLMEKGVVDNVFEFGKFLFQQAKG